VVEEERRQNAGTLLVMESARFNAVLTARRHKAATVLVALLVFVAVLGAISVDFGNHWDESQMLGQVQNSFGTGLLLSRKYNYPSLCYDLYLVAAVPHVAPYIVDEIANGRHLHLRDIAKPLSHKSFLLHIRLIFFLLSVSSAIAVYRLVGKISGNRWSALFGAAVLLGSWELIYHARWGVSDCLVASFCCWSIYFQLMLMKTQDQPHQRRYFLLASVFAGLSAAAKYPGGIVVLPLVLAIIFAAKHSPSSSIPYRQIGISLLIIVAVFIAITPGCILEPWNFAADVFEQIRIYNTNFHGQSLAVESDKSHLYSMLEYIGVVSLSRNPWASCAIASVAVLGAAALVYQQRRLGIWLAIGPIVYIAYMSRQNLMVVRNYMILIPFVAVFSALGLGWLWAHAKQSIVFRFLLVGAAFVVVAFNFGTVAFSAWSIYSPKKGDGGEQLEAYIAENPETAFYLSKQCRNILGEKRISKYPNIATETGHADRYVFCTYEVIDIDIWTLMRNVRGRYHAIFGEVDDVNWDYYPVWCGGHLQILDVSAADSRLAKLRNVVRATNGTGSKHQS
jgi:hypothetical protein